MGWAASPQKSSLRLRCPALGRRVGGVFSSFFNKKVEGLAGRGGAGSPRRRCGGMLPGRLMLAGDAGWQRPPRRGDALVRGMMFRVGGGWQRSPLRGECSAGIRAGSAPRSGGDAPRDASCQRRSLPASPCRFLIFLSLSVYIYIYFSWQSKTNPALFVVAPAVIPRWVK